LLGSADNSENEAPNFWAEKRRTKNAEKKNERLLGTKNAEKWGQIKHVKNCCLLSTRTLHIHIKKTLF